MLARILDEIERIICQKELIIYIGGFELPDKNAAAQRVIGNSKALRDLGYETVFDWH